MQAPAHASHDDIDITSLWSVLRRNAARIAGASAIMGLGTLAMLTLVPARYTSEAQLQIGGQGINDPFRDPKVGAGPSFESVAVKVDKEAIASQVVALRSRDLATRVAGELELAKREEFNGALAPSSLGGRLARMAGLAGASEGESEEERVLNAYYKALRVFQVRDTRVITLEFTAQDGELAARAANRLAELYQDWLRSQSVTQTEDASQWLRPQVDKMTREVAEAEAEVERFRSRANLFRGGGASSSGLNEQQLTDLSAEVTKARSARGEAEARARSARELIQRGIPDAIAEVQRSPIIQGLIGQRTRAEREKAEADTALLAGHPRMKQLNANVADLRRQVNKEALVIVESLEKEAKAAALREELASKSLDEMKARVGTTAGDIARLGSLEGLAKAKRRELETLQASFEAARSRGDVKSVPLEAQIISRARPSGVPSSPKRLQLASLAAIAGLVLGLALTILMELFSSVRRSGPAQAVAAPTTRAGSAQGVTGPVGARGRLAGATARDRTPATASLSAPSDAISASIEAIAQRLLANAKGQSGYRTVLTGAAAGLATHAEAAGLAAALAAAGRQVVLVDWSGDGSGMSRALGVQPAPGLSELLKGKASFEDVIRRLADGEAHIVACGAPRPGGLELDADRINLVLDALDEAYDHVIVAGGHAAIQELFLAIQGRFDAGIVVSDAQHRVPAAEGGEGMFLGFQVTDIDVIGLERGEGSGRRKLRLARPEPGAEARA